MKKSKQCPKCDSLSIACIDPWDSGSSIDGSERVLYLCEDCGYSETYYPSAREYTAAINRLDFGRVKWLNPRTEKHGPCR